MGEDVAGRVAVTVLQRPGGQEPAGTPPGRGLDWPNHPLNTRYWVLLTDTDQVQVVTTDGELVAEHPRCWARHQTIADPEHAEAG